MPIYKPTQSDFRQANESDKLKVTDIINIRNVLKDAKATYQYHYMTTFNNSISLGNNSDIVIATFDIFGTCIPDADYVQMLEALIIQANELLLHHKKYKYRNFQFDIIGSWTKGKISIFTKK